MSGRRLLCPWTDGDKKKTTSSRPGPPTGDANRALSLSRRLRLKRRTLNTAQYIYFFRSTRATTGRDKTRFQRLFFSPVFIVRISSSFRTFPVRPATIIYIISVIMSFNGFTTTTPLQNHHRPSDRGSASPCGPTRAEHTPRVVFFLLSVATTSIFFIV